EIIGIMSNSPNNAQSVFDAILESAVRWCEAQFALAYRLEGELVRLVGHHNYPLETLEEFRRSFPQRLRRAGVIVVPMLTSGRALEPSPSPATRRGPYPFCHDRIEFLQTFASQAVIANENVRLFEEVQAQHAGPYSGEAVTGTPSTCRWRGSRVCLTRR